MNNVIFLDIDGPLIPGAMWFHKNNSQIRKQYGTSWFRNQNDMADIKKLITFDPVAVEWFNIWQEMGNAKIVLATNWTLWLDHTEIVELLESNGMRVDLHDDPKTDKLFTSNRMNEIGAWMDEHPEVDRAMIVDDDADIKRYAKWFDQDSDAQSNLPCDSWHKKTTLIDVDFSDGLSLTNFSTACKWLDIDMEDVGEEIFGQVKLTPEEKVAEQKAFDMLARCAI